MGEILKCFQMKAACQYFSRGAVNYAVEGGSNLTLGEILKCNHSNESY